MSLVEIPLNSAWRSISAEDFSYSSACCFCSAAVGGGGSFVSGCGMASIFLGGCSCSSGTSLRNSPSAVNSRRSVTVKVSFFFSGISRVDRTLLSDQNLRRSLGTATPQLEASSLQLRTLFQRSSARCGRIPARLCGRLHQSAVLPRLSTPRCLYLHVECGNQAPELHLRSRIP